MSKPKKLRRLIKSAKMGNPSAMYRLGILIHQSASRGSLSEAAAWISRSADAGYAPAREWLNDLEFDDSALVQAES